MCLFCLSVLLSEPMRVFVSEFVSVRVFPAHLLSSHHVRVCVCVRISTTTRVNSTHICALSLTRSRARARCLSVRERVRE